VQEQGRDLFPQIIIPLNLMTNLNQAGKIVLIHGLMVLDKPTFIAAVRPEQFPPFYIYQDQVGIWWKADPNGIRNNWGNPNVQRRFNLALVQLHFKKPPIIKQNEDFERGVNGLFSKVIREKLVNAKQQYTFKGSPIEYMTKICEAINMEKMEPMIGAWKLKQVFQTLFPKQQEVFSPALGGSLWRYGMPQGFAMEFESDLLQDTLLENQQGKKFEAHTWMTYHPKSAYLAKLPDDYNRYKEQINKFANEYQSSFERLSELRKVYREIVNTEVEFVGYHHPAQGKKLVIPTKDKHIIGLSPGGKWVILGKGNGKILAYSPLFILRSDYGLDTRRLPTIPETWHKFPPILSY
jgi:hypothetical protein